MNILEALKEVEAGKIVRSETDNDVHFYIQTTLVPFQTKQVQMIDANALDDREKILTIKDLEDYFYADFRICIKYLRSDKYELVTELQMVAECERIRTKNRE